MVRALRTLCRESRRKRPAPRAPACSRRRAPVPGLPCRWRAWYSNRIVTPAALDGTLAQAAERAHGRWAARGVHGELAAFLPYVEARAAQLDESLRGRLHVDDLYLAFACRRGDRAALAAFEAELAPVARRAFARLNVPAEVGDDVLGALRERLFVASGDRSPLVDDYSGRGPLAAWLRSLAANAALKALRDRRRFVDVEQADELPMADAELLQLRGAGAAAFRDAFDRAFAALSREQRNLLRQHFLDGLTFEALARLHGVHVSTAWRRVEAARVALVAAVRARLEVALGLSESAANSVVRSAYVEASVASLLRGTPARAVSGELRPAGPGRPGPPSGPARARPGAFRARASGRGPGRFGRGRAGAAPGASDEVELARRVPPADRSMRAGLAAATRGGPSSRRWRANLGRAAWREPAGG